MTGHVRLIVDCLRDLARRRVVPADIAEMPLSEMTAIDDLGIDSIGKLNLLSEIEERADVALNEAALANRRTLGDLAAMLAELER